MVATDSATALAVVAIEGRSGPEADVTVAHFQTHLDPPRHHLRRPYQMELYWNLVGICVFI